MQPHTRYERGSGRGLMIGGLGAQNVPHRQGNRSASGLFLNGQGQGCADDDLAGLVSHEGGHGPLITSPRDLLSSEIGKGALSLDTDLLKASEVEALLVLEEEIAVGGVDEIAGHASSTAHILMTRNKVFQS